MFTVSEYGRGPMARAQPASFERDRRVELELRWAR